MSDKQKIIEVDGVTYVPYMLLNAERARHRKERRQDLLIFVIAIVAIIGIVMFAWCQYETVDEVTTTEYSYVQDGQGFNNLNTGSQGDVVNGAKTDNQENNRQTNTP